MSGILSPSQRNTAISRLKAAAERVVSAYAKTSKGKMGAIRKATAATSRKLAFCCRPTSSLTMRSCSRSRWTRQSHRHGLSSEN